MLSGRKALNHIDQTLSLVRHEAVRLDEQLSSLVGQSTLAQRKRLTLLGQIAKIRLSEIESGELDTEFNAADRLVVEILARRDEAIVQLNETITTLNLNIDVGETERQALLEQCNSVSERIASMETDVQTQLKADSNYLEQFSLAQAAESISEEAEHKVTQANDDMAEKAKPFESDELFMYLWRRGYGTAEYSGGLIGRFMDGWVARLIKYEDARVNFWNLNEIPKRLIEHADRVADTADREMRTLQQYELDALSAAGVPALQAELEMMRAQLDAHDDGIEAQEAELNDALQQRARFHSGSDDFLHQCVNRMTQALQHQSLTSIHRYVKHTHSPVDDELVIELQELEDSLSSLKGDMAGVSKLHDGQINKLRELESVRQQFKHSRFDDVRSEFANSELIAGVLSQFVQGVVSGADLWGTIKRNQRHRNVGAAPDFGSGGLGELMDVLGDQPSGSLGDILRPKTQGRRRPRKRRGSSWHIPRPRKNGGGFQFPRSVGRRNGANNAGGFKTGGGF